MNVENIKANQQKLLDYLKSNNYQKDAYWLIKKCIRLVLDYGPEADSYMDVFLREVNEKGYKPNEPRYKALLCYMGNVMRFDLEGKFPDRKKHCALMPKTTTADLLNDEYKALWEQYCNQRDNSNLCKKSFNTRQGVLAQLLLHFQKCNAMTLSDVTEPVILSFFYDGEKHVRGKDYCFLVKKALSAIAEQCDDTCVKETIDKIISWLPHIKSGEKPYPYLKKDELDSIRAALENVDNKLTHRDRMVGWMLLYWGLRGTDIVALKKCNIDWNHDMVNLIQSKTGQPLSLPLVAPIGNEMFDYIQEERRCTDTDDTILMRKGLPATTLGSVSDIVKKIFKIAGVRQDGNGGGVRLMRHNFVTFLLANGVACDVVSSLVGHTSPTSLKPYADSDLDHLKACSLSIEEYKMPEDYFKL